MDEGLEINNQKALDEIHQMLMDVSGELNILEEQVDVKIQIEYLNYSEIYDIKEELSIDDIRSQIFNEDLFRKQAKNLLYKLASINDAEAYRLIEKYIDQQSPGYLKDWAILARQHSKMLIHSSLLDEKQVFISTGMGGKGTKLRYFIVLISVNESLTEFQSGVIKKEVKYHFEKNNSELENIEFSDNFTKITALIPIQVTISDLLSNSISECNTFGSFLKSDFLVTNVKAMSDSEIYEIVNDKKSKKIDEHRFNPN